MKWWRVLCLGALIVGGHAADRVMVFAAASTHDALSTIARDYTQRTGVEVVCNFAATSTLARQIEQGAPADIFLSADAYWMDALQRAGAIRSDTRVDVLRNHLVLITPRAHPLQITVAPATDLAALFRGRIALADPASVPAGRYAQDAFTKLGWWSALEKRLAPTANVRAALQLVEQGECAVGVVYASDVTGNDRVQVAGIIPDELHMPVSYPLALTTDASTSAAGFYAYVRSPSASAIFQRFGFEPIHETVAAQTASTDITSNDDAVWTIVRLSLAVACMAVLVLVVPGVLLGWVLSRCRFPGRAALDVLVHLPLVLPPVVTGYVLLLVLGRQGVIGGWLHSIGIDIAFSFTGAVLAAAVMALPLLVRAVRIGFDLTDRRLEDAARTLGASPWRVFMTITVPLALPALIAGMVLAFARSLGEFGATITLAGNIPEVSRTLPLAIWSLSQTPNGEAAAMRLVVVAIILSVLALIGSEWLQRRLQRSAS